MQIEAEVSLTQLPLFEQLVKDVKESSSNVVKKVKTIDEVHIFFKVCLLSVVVLMLFMDLALVDKLDSIIHPIDSIARILVCGYGVLLLTLTIVVLLDIICACWGVRNVSQLIIAVLKQHNDE